MYKKVPLGWLGVITSTGSTIGVKVERLLTLMNYLQEARAEYPDASNYRKAQLVEIAKYNQDGIAALEGSHSRKLKRWSKSIVLASDYYNDWAGYAYMIEYLMITDTLLRSGSDELLDSVRCRYLNFEMRTLDLKTGRYFYPQYSKMPDTSGFVECEICELPRIEGV